MPLYILDTDSITFHQVERETVLHHVRSLPAEAVCTTVITLYEQMRGRVARIHRAQTSPALIAACAQLQKTVHYFSQIPILPFTPTAAQYFEEFRKKKNPYWNPGLTDSFDCSLCWWNSCHQQSSRFPENSWPSA